jgi:hypothetical protein
MAQDGVRQDGIFLKPFDDIVGAKIWTLEIDSIGSALKEQVGYKLAHVLRGRLDLPTGVEEILMGDDSEADFVVYSIYHRMMTGELDQAGIVKELTRAGVDPRSTEELAKLAEKVRASLGGKSLVKVIYINLTGFPSEKLKVDEWPLPGIMRYHRGAWPLMLDLYEEGLVSKESIATVKARLIELGQSQKDLDESAGLAVKSGYLKPETLSVP